MSEADWEAYHTPEKVRREFFTYDDSSSSALDYKPVLDHPSEPHPILSALMDEALLRILLTADGRAQTLTERVTGSHPGTMAPTSDLAATLDALSRDFMRCRTHRARLVIIKAAQRTADRLRHAPDRSKVRGTAEWRQAIAADPRKFRAIAAVYGVSISTVSSIKKAVRSAT